MKHKSDDYKISAVNYYLKNKDNIRTTCKIFDCSKSSLQRWIQKYKTSKNLTRKNRNPVSYKINKEQVKTALNTIDKNEQITMNELLFSMKQKYNNLDITSQHLGSIVRANNRTKKRTRHKHFPKERWKQPTNQNRELETFYNEVRKYPFDNI
jgi:transposase